MTARNKLWQNLSSRKGSGSASVVGRLGGGGGGGGVNGVSGVSGGVSGNYYTYMNVCMYPGSTTYMTYAYMTYIHECHV